MNSEQQKALEKIKKCLKLAGSANAGEADNAMRQAKALMEKFGLNDLDIALSDVGERLSGSSAAEKPVRYETWLADICAQAFDCELIFSHGIYLKKGAWKFIGVEPTPELASYCFDVLLRQLKRDRKTYQDTKLKRFGRKNKIAMADQFCEGWVSAIHQKIKQIANNDSKRQALAKQYLANKYQALGQLKANVNVGNVDPYRTMDARASGRHAGSEANLNRGLNDKNPAKSLEHRA